MSVDVRRCSLRLERAGAVQAYIVLGTKSGKGWQKAGGGRGRQRKDPRSQNDVIAFHMLQKYMFSSSRQKYTGTDRTADVCKTYFYPKKEHSAHAGCLACMLTGLAGLAGLAGLVWLGLVRFG